MKDKHAKPRDNSALTALLSEIGYCGALVFPHEIRAKRVLTGTGVRQMNVTGPFHGVPEGYLASGPSGRQQHADHAATFQNDNGPPDCGALPDGARMLVLSQDIDTADQPILMIRILLANGSLMPALHIARDSFEVIALWKGFARDLNLPMGMLDESGKVIAISHAPGEESHARRGGSPLTHRRTRTARKRQVPLQPWKNAAQVSPLSA